MELVDEISAALDRCLHGTHSEIVVAIVAAHNTAQELADETGGSRELSLALTKLDEAIAWIGDTVSIEGWGPTRFTAMKLAEARQWARLVPGEGRAQ